LKDLPPVAEWLCVTIVALCLTAQIAFALGGAWTSSLTMTLVMFWWAAYVWMEDGEGDPTTAELADLDVTLDMLEAELDELDERMERWNRP
jgi:hypothetical protein